MDPVKQQLRLLGQNRALRAVAIAASLVEAVGDDADTLMLEGLAMLADRHAGISATARDRLEQAMLVGWDRLSTPARSLARRQHQPILRRVLERAAGDEHEAIRRKAIDLARALATERDQSAWGVLAERLGDESTAIVRAAAEAIAFAGERLGVNFPHAEPAVIGALNTYDRHRSEKILLLVAEQADKAQRELLTWLGTDACAGSGEGNGDQEIAQHALRAAAKRLSSGTMDRLVPVWLGMPCLAPVAARRLQQATELADSKAGKAGKSARANAATQAWANLFAAVPIRPAPSCIEALQRIGPEAVAEAAVQLASGPTVVRLVMHACKGHAQREAALIRLLAAREPSIRLVALQTLVRGVPTAPADQAIAGLAYDDEPSVAAAAVLALARFSSPNRHARIETLLAPFADHPHPGVRHAAATARRLTDPVGDIIATAETPLDQPLPWRAPIGVRAAVARDPAAIARSLQRIATDPKRPPALTRTARRLLNRVLPLPPRVPAPTTPVPSIATAARHA